MNTLRAENLSFKNILSPINATFEQGKLYGIVGPNGSGKTTLLKSLIGLLPPTTGATLWNEKPLNLLDRKAISHTLSFVPHHPPIYFDYTASEIVEMGAYAKNHTSSESVMAALAEVQMESFAGRNIRTLSSGEKQLVYIARSLAASTPVLLLDEPTANLDVHHQIMVWKLLRKLVLSGVIVLVTVHDLRSAERETDEVAVIQNGHLVGMGAFEQTITEEVLNKVFYIAAIP